MDNAPVTPKSPKSEVGSGSSAAYFLNLFLEMQNNNLMEIVKGVMKPASTSRNISLPTLYIFLYIYNYV